MRFEVCDSIMEKGVISVAVVVSAPMKGQNPAASYTLKEVVCAAIECC